MLRVIVLGFIVIMNLVIQSSVAQAVSIYHVSFNLFVITVVTFSLLRGQREGMFIGFAIGLMQDIFFGDVVGFYALIYMYMGFIIGRFSKTFFKDNYLIPVIAIGASSLIMNLIVYVTFLFRGRTQFFFYFFTKMVPEMTYTVLVSIVFYRLYLWVDDRLEHYNRWKGSRDKL